MSLFTRLDVTYAGTQALPTVSPSDIEFFSEYEENAYEHWIFDTGTGAGLVGKVNGISLIPQTNMPSFSSNFISINGEVGKGLKTGLLETGADVFTFFCVSRSDSSGGNPQVLFGNYTGSSGAGFMLAESTNTTLTKRFYMRGTTNAHPAVIGDTSANAWVFSAVSMNTALGSDLVNGLINQTINNSVTVTGTYSRGSNEIVLANGYYPTGGAITKDYAEFGIIKGFYSIAELTELYNRSKARMLARGITVI